ADLKKANELFLVSSLDRTGAWMVQDGKLIIPCSDGFQALKVEEASKKIEAAVAGMTGQNFTVEVQKPKKQENVSPVVDKPAISPAVEMVKKVFKGEIV
ncbi:MAG: hypothetical protein IKT97_04110, partial [Spirochaetia bacterium]|nr:hypothetical protein [Spirochaetia bacterium]